MRFGNSSNAFFGVCKKCSSFLPTVWNSRAQDEVGRVFTKSSVSSLHINATHLHISGPNVCRTPWCSLLKLNTAPLPLHKPGCANILRHTLLHIKDVPAQLDAYSAPVSALSTYIGTILFVLELTSVLVCLGCPGPPQCALSPGPVCTISGLHPFSKTALSFRRWSRLRWSIYIYICKRCSFTQMAKHR